MTAKINQKEMDEFFEFLKQPVPKFCTAIPSASAALAVGSAEKVAELGGLTQPQATTKGGNSLPLTHSPSRSAAKLPAVIGAHSTQDKCAPGTAAQVSCGTAEGRSWNESERVAPDALRGHDSGHGSETAQLGAAECGLISEGKTDSGNQAPPAGIFQGNSSQSVDDGYEEEGPYWTDSMTAAEMWRAKGAK